MGLNKATLCFLLMLVLFLASKETVPVAADEHKCKDVPSKKFYGKCYNDHKCYNACIHEGYKKGGHCNHHYHCMCKYCY